MISILYSSLGILKFMHVVYWLLASDYDTIEPTCNVFHCREFVIKKAMCI